MATNKTVVNAAGHDREVALQAPGTAITAADTNQFDIQSVPAGVSGVVVNVNIAAISTSTVTVKIYSVDTFGIARLLLTSAALSATGLKTYRVHPNLTSDLNAGVSTVAQDVIGSRVRVELINSAAASTTYSVSAALVY